MFRHRLSRSAALGLTLAAVVAPGALAQQDLRSPDARDAAPAPQQIHRNFASPDARDRAEGRSTLPAPKVTIVRVTEPAPAAPTDGVDWWDVAMGAGFAVVLALIVLGVRTGIHRTGTTRRSTTTRIA